MQEKINKTFGSIPLISLERIKNYCGYNIYEQAMGLISSDLLLCQFQENKTLKAYFSNFVKENFSVKVKFDFRNITFSSCSCPENNNGPCVHIALVLISWHYNPHGFTDLSQLSKKLDGISKEELLSLLCTVVQYDSDTKDINDTEITACG